MAKSVFGRKFHKKNGVFFFWGGEGFKSTRWLVVLESLWQRRPNVFALFAVFLLLLWRYFRAINLIPHARRRWLTTSEKASKGVWLQIFNFYKILGSISIILNSSLRQYWRKSWTFFQRNWALDFFIWEGFKVEILPDIEVSFFRPNYGKNNEYIFWKSVHICKLFC